MTANCTGEGAKVDKIAIIVSYTDFESSSWNGDLPKDCPDPASVFKKGKCPDSNKKCYVTGTMDKTFSLPCRHDWLLIVKTFTSNIMAAIAERRKVVTRGYFSPNSYF